jgi:hypothetical protein
MPYSQFTTIGKVKMAFGLTVLEGDRFLPEIEPLPPSEMLLNYLAESLPIVSTSGSEKARSEGIIYPVLLEVRRLLERRMNLFSGESFDVDESVGLNGQCDFLITRSIEILEISSPVVVLVEAKKTDLKTGIGQCLAEMVAAQRFNEAADNQISTIYGCVSNGLQWQFLKLSGKTAMIDLTVYALSPIDRILGLLGWMAESG